MGSKASPDALEKRHLLHHPGLDHQLLGHVARSLIAIPSGVSRVLSRDAKMQYRNDAVTVASDSEKNVKR
jgi:hypothetical protein